eukprot:6788289-Pyramimonas_sp.AAC.1
MDRGVAKVGAGPQETFHKKPNHTGCLGNPTSPFRREWFRELPLPSFLHPLQRGVYHCSL